MEKLSSGLRINRAGDDAAGLAISEKMRGQIRGLDMAAKNSQDGISLIQTAEGALNETHSILQRMRELSVQASNDTNTGDDRAEIQKEIDQLVDEIDRIGNTTEFNTKKLLNGQAGVSASGQSGVYNNAIGQDITINGVAYNGTGANAAISSTDLNAAISSMTAGADTQSGVYSVVVSKTATQATLGDAQDLNGAGAAAPTATVAQTGDLTVNGVKINVASTDTYQDVIDKLNNVSSQTGITAAVGSTSGGLQLTTTAYGSDATISVSGAEALLEDLGLQAAASTGTVLSSAGTDAVATINGTAAVADGNTLTATSGASEGLVIKLDGSKINLDADGGGDDSDFQFNAVVDASNIVSFQIGANENQDMNVSISDMRASALSVDNIDVTSTASAKAAITTIDDAIKQVSGERSKLGAYQNRLEHTINNLGTSSENLTAAESRIRDVDMAKEMMNQTKNSILSQAAQAMLAQANQQPQGVLQLLR
ncbi:flagellin [Metabacillus sp. YM-086]|uniref:flagellin N-terminal helical domain-containing protein n=1 Tax=Metabacillus sp. YM-086 TaxID=3341729 RepID=UPI003A866C41